MYEITKYDTYSVSGSQFMAYGSIGYFNGSWLLPFSIKNMVSAYISGTTNGIGIGLFTFNSYNNASVNFRIINPASSSWQNMAGVMFIQCVVTTDTKVL